MAIEELRLVLTMDDFDGAIAFFRDVLGLKELATWGNNGGHGVLLDAGQATLEIFDERLLAPEGIQLTLFAPDEGS
jgi:lactoylglutathione lyase